MLSFTVGRLAQMVAVMALMSFVIFGLIGSTILTLIVQPVAYMSLELWRKHDFSEQEPNEIEAKIREGQLTAH